MTIQCETDLYFLQSARDIVYLIPFWENTESKRKLIFVTTPSELDPFLKGLPIKNFELVNVPYYDKPIWGMLKEAILYRKLWHKWLRSTEIRKCYFCTNYFDYATFFFLNRITCRELIFVDHYKLKRPKSPSVSAKKKLFKIAIRVLFGVKGTFTGKEGIFTASLNYRNLVIDEPFVNPEIIGKYQVKLGHRGRKNALIFGNESPDLISSSNYKRVMTRLVTQLQSQDYEVYVKGHPRTGISKFFRDQPVKELNSSLPAEFLDWGEIDLAVGIHSAALASIPPNGVTKVISLINLVEYFDQLNVEKYRNYLEQITINQIQYPSSWETIL